MRSGNSLTDSSKLYKENYTNTLYLQRNYRYKEVNYVSHGCRISSGIPASFYSVKASTFRPVSGPDSDFFFPHAAIKESQDPRDTIRYKTGKPMDGW